ncbi:MAG: RNB domain-containing ribonuclease [Thermoleophilia bacterium]|nr:RNB domain-containing ribonuclease [Thermoleophilia bacterium]
MRTPRIAGTAPATLAQGFDAIRAELELPGVFPPDVEDAAERAAAVPVPPGRADRRDLPFITIDPPGSTDLDQALHIAPDGDGWVLSYAIADIGLYAPAGGPVDAEARSRGETIYLPDRRTLLYPAVLTEGAASLLPDVDRPCVLFTIPVGADGEIGEGRVEPALMRSTDKLAYQDVGPRTVPHLRAMGEALAAAGERRGTTRIDLPEATVAPDPAAPSGYRLDVRERLPSEEWNEQVSLAANIVAARKLVAARTGLFRDMGPADPERIAGLRAAAVALGFTVPDEEGPAALAHAHAPSPEAAAELRRGARAAAGAGYAPFDPERPPFHAAVAAAYSHATAPMRRMADRHVLDALVALDAGAPAPVTAWGELAKAMNAADSRAARADAAALDLVEAFLLAPRVGAEFDAVVTGATEDGVRIQLRDPPARAAMGMRPPAAPGTALRVRLTAADLAKRRLTFAPV